MTVHYDRSDRDKKYFIDGSVYNCPFCNRRHVSYAVIDQGEFNSSNTKTTYYYLVRCNDCDKTSFHLSEYEIETYSKGRTSEKEFSFPPKQLTLDATKLPFQNVYIRCDIIGENGKPKELDELFFYHLPTAFFTIDNRIPKSIREPLSEADNCFKNNFLTGASGCLRKAIYKLLQHEKIPEIDKQNDTFLSHNLRVDFLKEKYPKIDAELFDDLKAIHILTSQELHENDWKDFDSTTLRFLLEVTQVILTEIYVTPDEIQKRRENISALKKKAKPSYIKNAINETIIAK